MIMRIVRQNAKDRKNVSGAYCYTLASGSTNGVKQMQHKFFQAFGSMLITAGLFSGVVSVMAAAV